jgi:hypothetical protein
VRKEGKREADLDVVDGHLHVPDFSEQDCQSFPRIVHPRQDIDLLSKQGRGLAIALTQRLLRIESESEGRGGADNFERDKVAKFQKFQEVSFFAEGAVEGLAQELRGDERFVGVVTDGRLSGGRGSSGSEWWFV